MRAHERAFAQLEAANPVGDIAQNEPTRADAIAFLRSIEEEPMDTQRLTNSPTTTKRPAGRWLIAVAAFVAVFAAGGVLGFFAGGSEAPRATVTSTSTTTGALPVVSVVEEPAQLAELRAALNAGDAMTAASIHTEEGVCDRFFTTGTETCADWYAFLVGIGTRTTATTCAADPDGGVAYCHWTLESDAHRSLGVDSVEWEFTGVSVEGWGAVQPDGNLFSGTAGKAALDDEFWAFVTLELVRREPDLAEAAKSSNRVPATLDADFAAVVLEAATAFPGS